MHRLQNALCGAFMLSLISSTSVVCSGSATLNLATALLLRLDRASTCSGPFCGSHFASSGSSAPVFAPVHASRCSDRPIQGMEPVELPQFSALSVCGGILVSHLCWHVNVHVHVLRVGILLTDFAAACPSANHSWIFHVLKKAASPEFISRFL